jgi:YD repeat-containing protein
MSALAQNTRRDYYTRAANEDCINGGPGTRTKYSYDAAGDTTGYAGDSFTYNQRGRMASAATSSGSTSYLYNALGQMMEKSNSGGATYLMYDEAGHIIGEYSSTGSLIEETVWFNNDDVMGLASASDEWSAQH